MSRFPRFAIITIAFVLSVMLAPGIVTAGLIYDESVNGDLPQDATLAPLLTLVAGTNEIRGNTGFNTDFAATDFDSFRIHVAPGDSVVAALLTLTASSGNLTTAQWGFDSQFNLVHGLGLVGATTSVFSDFLPAGAGDYAIVAAALVARNPGGFADYTFSFEVRSPQTAVPEPDSIILWSTMAAFGGLAVVIRRRKLAQVEPNSSARATSGEQVMYPGDATAMLRS